MSDTHRPERTDRPKGWRVHIDHRTPRHVWPQNDVVRHVVNGQRCWCKPKAEAGVVIHNSLDGREAREAVHG